MDVFSLLSGVDNLRKFAVMLGLSLIGVSIIFPMQKKQELKMKIIQLELARKIDSLEVKNIEKDVNKSNLIISANSLKLKTQRHLRDSLMKLKLNDNLKMQIEHLDSELNSLTIRDETNIKDIKTKYIQIEQAQIKTDSLEKEICNLESFITSYTVAQVCFFILGVILFFMGMYKWNKSQMESDRLKDIEIKIQEEELIKIRKENSRL